MQKKRLVILIALFFIVASLFACNNEIDPTITSYDYPSESTTLPEIPKEKSYLYMNPDDVAMDIKGPSSYYDPDSNEINYTALDFYDEDLNYAAVGSPNSSNATYANVPTIICPTVITKNDLVVSATADEFGIGTEESPMTINNAIDNLKLGQTIFLKAGTYKFSTSRITLQRNGNVNAYLKMVAYNGGYVKFDFSGQTFSEEVSLNERGIQIEGNYWYLNGIHVYGSADNGIFISGNYNIVENCVLEANRDTGLQISRRNSTLKNFNAWPHNNLVLNCTSFNNYSIYNEASGFASKLTCGNNNTFDGCISYNNSSNGFDLYTAVSYGAIGRVIILNCVAFENGKLLNSSTYTDGDGNGFKLGGENIKGNHYVNNCVSFNNASHGFTDNSNPGTITISNCTSYNNSLKANNKSNIDFNRNGDSLNYFSGILSINTSKQANDKYAGKAEYSLFYNAKYYYVSTLSDLNEKTGNKGGGFSEITPANIINEFASIDAPTGINYNHNALRNSDGTINLGDFLKLKSTSILNSMGPNNKYVGANLSNTVSDNQELKTNNMINCINNLNEATFSSAYLFKLNEAIAQYNSLPLLLRKNITNRDKLISLINDFNTLAIEYINDLIENFALTSFSLETKAYINEVDIVYESLSNFMKSFIDNYQAFEKIKNDFLNLQTSAITKMINNITVVLLNEDFKNQLLTVENIINSLTENEKALINNLDNLNRIRNAYNIALLIEKIDEKNINYISKSIVLMAYEQYKNLDSQEKSYISQLTVITKIERCMDIVLTIEPEFSKSLNADYTRLSYKNATIDNYFYANGTINVNTSDDFLLIKNSLKLDSSSKYNNKSISFEVTNVQYFELTLVLNGNGTNKAITINKDGEDIEIIKDVRNTSKNTTVTLILESGKYYLYSETGGVFIKDITIKY